MTRRSKPVSISINSDMGESLGIHSFGNDDGLLELVDTVNIACGFHSGDPSGIHETVIKAAEAGHEQCVLELLKAGAAVDYMAPNGPTALMLSCQNGHEQCALALIEAKADLEKQTEIGNTALILACQNGHEQCARALIEAGANLESKQNEGWTALMYCPKRVPGQARRCKSGKTHAGSSS